MRNTILFLILLCVACQTPTEKATVPETPTAQETKDTVKTVTDIKFEPVENLSTLVKEYPFLKEEIGNLTLPDPMGTELVVAKATLGENKFVFTRLEGALYRGTEGSPVEVYLDRGKGYKHALSVTTHRDITIVTTPSLALLLPLSDGTRARWAFNDTTGQFDLAE